MQSAWLSAFAFLLVSTLVGAGLLGAASVLRVRAKYDSPLKHNTYECGEEPAGMSWMQFHARYYVVALFFVLFDVEAAFFFPWATVLREEGTSAFIAAVTFAAVLMLGWFYAVRKEALEWQ
jgi:NADH-quinone oxidoreductase subunit A